MSNFINNEAEAYAAGFHVVVSNKGEIIEERHETELKDAIIYYDLKVERFYNNPKLYKYINVVLFLLIFTNSIKLICRLNV